MPFPFQFPQDANLKAGAVRTIRDGSDYVVPTGDISSAAFLLTNQPLAASAVYTEPTQSRFGNVIIDRVRGQAFADQAGTLYVEEADVDGAWTAIVTKAVAANQLADTGWVWLSKKLYRFRYVNGATAQTSFVLYESQGVGQLSVAGIGTSDDAVVNAGAAGSVSAKLRRVTTDLDAVKTLLAKTAPANGQALMSAIAEQALLKALRSSDPTKEELLQAIAGALWMNPRNSAGAELFTAAAPGEVLGSLKASTYQDTVLQNNAAAIGNGTAAVVSGFGSVLVQVTGNFVATLVPEVTLDGVNWTPLVLIDRNTGAPATSITAPGIYRGDVNGVAQFRMRISSYTSGQVTATCRAMPVPVATQSSVQINGRNVESNGRVRAAEDTRRLYPVSDFVKLTIPTYDGSGQAVHPSVVRVVGKRSGYEYWMAMTPYANSNPKLENPSILASTDGITWVVPAGLTNPLVTPPGTADAWWYGDPCLIWDQSN